MEVVGKTHGRYLCGPTVPADDRITPHEKVCYPVPLPPLENAIGFVHNETGLASGNDAWSLLIMHATSLASTQKDLILGRSQDYPISHPVRHDLKDGIIFTP